MMILSIGSELVLAHPELVEREVAARVHPAEQRVRDRLRLVGDLLEHEVRVAALLGGGGVPVDVVRPALGRRAVEVGDRHAVPGDRHDLVLAELDRVARVRDERGDVRPEEVLAVAGADHQRRAAPGADDELRVVAVHGEQRERALEPPAHDAHRLGQVAARSSYAAGEQVRGHLGVGVGARARRRRGELVAQRGEVLDDPVVDHRDRAVGGEVRVRVHVVRRRRASPSGCGPIPVVAAVSGSPDVVVVARSASAFSRLVSLPARFSLHDRAVGSRRRRRPSRTRGTPAAAAPRARRPALTCSPTYPTIPHMPRG